MKFKWGKEKLWQGFQNINISLSMLNTYNVNVIENIIWKKKHIYTNKTSKYEENHVS
jgi:hypothetical protein